MRAGTSSTLRRRSASTARRKQSTPSLSSLSKSSLSSEAPPSKTNCKMRSAQLSAPSGQLGLASGSSPVIRSRLPPTLASTVVFSTRTWKFFSSMSRLLQQSTNSSMKPSSSKKRQVCRETQLSLLVGIKSQRSPPARSCSTRSYDSLTMPTW